MATVIDLGQKVKAKYPGSYDNLSDEEVGLRVKAKYPDAYGEFDSVTAAPSAEAPRGFFGNLLEGGKGAIKSVGSAIAGASALGEQIATFGRTSREETAGGQLQESAFLKPQNAAQRIGFGAGEIAQFLIPTPLGKVGGVGKIAKFAAPLAEGIVKSAIQKGELTKGDVAGQTAISAAFASIPVVGKIAAATLGKSTGTAPGVVKEAFENPSVMEFARKAAKGGPELLKEALQDARNGFQRMVNDRAKQYVARLSKIKARPDDLGEIKQNAILLTQEALGEASVGLKKGKLTLGAFKDSAIEQGQNAVKKAYRTLNEWDDLTAAGLDNLKKKLNQFKNSVRNTTDGSYNVIKTMANSVDDGLKANVPLYKEMTSAYRAASETLDEIERALSPNSQNTDMAVRKLISSLRENNEIRNDFLKMLGGKANADIVGKIAGQELSALAPKGIAGRIFPSGVGSGVGFGALNPSNWPVLLLYIGASSPRLVGEAASLMGKATRGLPLKQVQDALRGILSQIIHQNDSDGSE